MSNLITTNLESNFKALKTGRPTAEQPFVQDSIAVQRESWQADGNNYPSPGTASTVGMSSGGGMIKTASSGVTYGQPQFFSPVHTPINWQIPTKRKEIYQWSFVSGDELTTCEGFLKPIEDIAVGDQLITHTGEVGTVDKTHNRVVDTELYSVTVQGFYKPAKWTKGHEIHCIDKKDILCKYSGNHTDRTRYCDPNNLHYMCRRTGCKDCLNKSIRPVLKKVEDLQEGDFLYTPIPRQVLESDINDINKARLLGYYCAEGCDAKPNTIIFTFNIHEIDFHNEVIQLCEDICTTANITAPKFNQYDRAEKSITQIHVTSQFIHDLCTRHCPNLSSQRILSESLFYLNPNLQVHFLATYWNGDGCQRFLDGKKGCIDFRTASKKLAEQLVLVLARCGYPAQCLYDKTLNNNEKSIVFHNSNKEFFEMYTISFGPSCGGDFFKHSMAATAGGRGRKANIRIFGDYLIRKIEKIHKEAYTGIVYDVRIPGNYSVVCNFAASAQCRFYYENEPKVSSAIDFYCFTPHMQVQLFDGKVKSISQVNVGENIISGDGSIQSINKKFVRHGSENILKIKVAGLTTDPIECTHGHELLVVQKESDNNEKYKFVQAKFVQEGDYLLTPCPKAGNITIEPERAWLVGLYAAEGCAIPYKWTSKKQVKTEDYKGVCFALNINESILADTAEEYIKRIYGNVNTTRRIDNNLLLLSVYSKNVADDLIGFCHGLSKNGTKRFIPFVNNWNEAALKQLISGFLAGDGCYNYKNGFQGVGVCRDMMYQISHYLDVLNIPHSINRQRPKICSEGRTRQTRQTVYNVRIPRRFAEIFNFNHKWIQNDDLNLSKLHNTPFFYEDGYIWRKVVKINEFSYKGELYDLEINGNHSYTINKIAVHNSLFPMNGFTLECKNRKVKHFYDKLIETLNLGRWLRVFSHEAYLLGDCFPFLEVNCNVCNGSGVTPRGAICEHPGGAYKRIVVLNPDYVEVYSNPLSPEPAIALLPDEELMGMVTRQAPGHEKLTPQVRALIAAGKPIPLDNRNVSHVKFGESGYNRYGISIVRRLFPTLAYKTKLMTAQWLVAERLILPIKIVKVGTDTRPASPQDIEAVKSQLAETANDPNVTLVTHHAFELDWFGACFDMNTEVLTENGWKKYEDVSKNYDEKIATYNINNDSIEYQVPQEYHHYDYNGEMLHFTSKEIDVLVTPNHNMLAARAGSTWKKIQASDVKVKMLFKIIDNKNQIKIKQIKSIQEIHYNDKVWCFTVPNGFFITRRNGKIGIHGNSGKVLQVQPEYEHIDQEILDGLMINKALLNGEGPTYSSAAIGVEAMIDRLESWRSDIKTFVEQNIFLPIAQMQGFVETNEWGEREYIYPRLKWNIMHLRDQQNYRQFILQLHEKGVVSNKRLLETFDIDNDEETEWIRFERAKQAGEGAVPGAEGMGAPGGLGGGFDAPLMGGGMEGAPMGGGMEGAPPGGGEAGMGPAMAGPAPTSTDVQNISVFGGKVLKRNKREKILKQKERLNKQWQGQQGAVATQDIAKQDSTGGWQRDEKGRIMLTGPERDLMSELINLRKDNTIKHAIYPQLEVKNGQHPYSIDFAIPSIKLGIEVDGYLFHSSEEQKKKDKERDAKLAQQGWTIIRFTDDEIDSKLRLVVESIIYYIKIKEKYILEQNKKME